MPIQGPAQGTIGVEIEYPYEYVGSTEVSYIIAGPYVRHEPPMPDNTDQEPKNPLIFLLTALANFI